MTEEEWLKATDPEPMLEFLGRPASPRKLRLLLVAQCRRNWHTLTEPEYREAVDLAEQYADGTADTGQLEAACHRASVFHHSAIMMPWRRGLPPERRQQEFLCYAQRHAVRAALPDDRLWLSLTRGAQTWIVRRNLPDEAKAECDLLRDLFGPLPFRPVALDPNWLSSFHATVPRIAHSIYDDRRFDELPILADALEEAGCSDADILGHLRGRGPHVRGCWVVDLILGRS